MSYRRGVALFALASCFCAGAVFAPALYAGPFDGLKNKLKDAATKQAEEAAKKATGKAGQPSPATTAEATPTGETATATPPGAAGGKVSGVSTKFDFVPGDSVMFFDDFKLDELGEFPARWRLVRGTFEVVEQGAERWARCTSVDGEIRMKRPIAPLPELWTLEFDFYATEPMASALTVRGLTKSDATVWEAVFPQGNDLAFTTGEIRSSTTNEASASPGGRHHVMFMARGTALKVYLDRQRMVNVPEVAAPNGMPGELAIRLWASTRPMITNVRFAEGCRPPKDMLAAGKLVTYGIRFGTGSDVVLPESAPVLRQIASYLQSDATVRLTITGHTDSVGSAESNIDLSKRRSAAVAHVLSDQFGIAADRFATDGKGATESVASNARPEGRAMNRRVEFTKF